MICQGNIKVAPRILCHDVSLSRCFLGVTRVLITTSHSKR